MAGGKPTLVNGNSITLGSFSLHISNKHMSSTDSVLTKSRLGKQAWPMEQQQEILTEDQTGLVPTFLQPICRLLELTLLCRHLITLSHQFAESGQAGELGHFLRSNNASDCPPRSCLRLWQKLRHSTRLAEHFRCTHCIWTGLTAKGRLCKTIAKWMPVLQYLISNGIMCDSMKSTALSVGCTWHLIKVD